MVSNAYWDREVEDSLKLIVDAAKSGNEPVGINRARAILEKDAEVKLLRRMVEAAGLVAVDGKLVQNNV